mmetsp:Transcript_68446/g.61503  ORF Transcript_68446/g.61503 Transcript_68446/m.61503 type:complete len:611 (+) Transcript_68446:99-1931(+)
MGAKLCTSKANRTCKENQGKNGSKGKRKQNTLKRKQNTLKRKQPRLHSNNSDAIDYRSASIHKKINNSSNIKSTPYSSLHTISDDGIPMLYEQLNDSIINRDNRLTLDINLDQNAPPLDPGFVMLSEPSNGASNDNLAAPAFPAFAKSNTSLCSSSFHLSPTYPTQKSLTTIDHENKSNECDDIIIDEDEIYTPPQHKMTIGDEIELNIEYNSLHGLIKFIGELMGKEGIWYGLQLNRPKGSDDVTYWKQQSNIHNQLLIETDSSDTQHAHKCDGCYDGICYFKCDDNEGLFVRETQIARILIVNFNNPRITINEEVFMTKYDTKGIIRYIGKPEFENDENIHETYYGLQLLHINKNSSLNEKEGNNGIFHDRRYFTDCPNNHGIFVMSSDLSQYVIPSRYNLLCHGYFQRNTNIPPVIIKLIEQYSNIIEIRLTHIPCPDPTIGNRILSESQMIIHRKYQLFDINNNLSGPSITVQKCGSNTQRKECKVSISGHYQFIKSEFVDLGDRNTRFVHRTEYDIFKFKNGGSETERIHRSIDTDNTIPLFKDYKSQRQRFNPRNNIHQDDTNLDMDQKKLIKDISDLYKVSPNEIIQQFKRYRIELYGLNDIF